MGFLKLVYFVILVNSIYFSCIMNCQETVKHHRMKRNFFLTNGTRFLFQALLTIPLMDTSDFVDGVIQITVPNIEYYLYTGFVARRLAQDQISFFRAAEDGLNGMGLNGRMCVLRTICEVAENPKHAIGLIGDAIDIIFRMNPDDENNETKLYINAHTVGLQGMNCAQKFSLCPVSFFNLDLFG